MWRKASLCLLGIMFLQSEALSAPLDVFGGVSGNLAAYSFGSSEPSSFIHFEHTFTVTGDTPHGFGSIFIILGVPEFTPAGEGFAGIFMEAVVSDDGYVRHGMCNEPAGGCIFPTISFDVVTFFEPMPWTVLVSITAFSFNTRPWGARLELRGDPGLVFTETPLPAALPLFAGGLGVMAFLARRRKQGSQ